MRTHIIVTAITMILGSLLVPIFAQWYEQNTGIFPLVFLSILIILSIANLIYLLFNIIDENS